jgi:hypothetical protein
MTSYKQNEWRDNIKPFLPALQIIVCWLDHYYHLFGFWCV